MSRCRRDRPDEERCCRGKSKSKLSHVTSPSKYVREGGRLCFLSKLSFRQTAVRLEVLVRSVSCHFKSSRASDREISVHPLAMREANA